LRRWPSITSIQHEGPIANLVGIQPKYTARRTFSNEGSQVLPLQRSLTAFRCFRPTLTPPPRAAACNRAVRPPAGPARTNLSGCRNGNSESTAQAVAVNQLQTTRRSGVPMHAPMNSAGI
jgi:hypothetical protein